MDSDRDVSRDAVITHARPKLSSIHVQHFNDSRNAWCVGSFVLLTATKLEIHRLAQIDASSRYVSLLKVRFGCSRAQISQLGEMLSYSRVILPLGSAHLAWPGLRNISNSNYISKTAQKMPKNGGCVYTRSFLTPKTSSLFSQLSVFRNTTTFTNNNYSVY